MCIDSRAPFFFPSRSVLVVGRLIRHATELSEDLGVASLLKALSDILRDKDVHVLRSGAATLGELIFYIASSSVESVKTLPIAIHSSHLGQRCESTRVCASKTLSTLAGESHGSNEAAVGSIQNIGWAVPQISPSRTG